MTKKCGRKYDGFAEIATIHRRGEPIQTRVAASDFSNRSRVVGAPTVQCTQTRRRRDWVAPRPSSSITSMNRKCHTIARYERSCAWSKVSVWPIWWCGARFARFAGV